MHRDAGVATAVFPHEPERSIYNNAVLTPGLGSTERVEAVEAMEDRYRAAGVTRFAAWVHEHDRPMRRELERRGYVFAESTRAMGLELRNVHSPPPEIELGPAEWSEHLRMFDLPPELGQGARREAFHVLTACLRNEAAATAIAFDFDADCGIYNVGTLEHARRRGLATALTALHLHRAIARGCQTASVQSTARAERVYAGVGFRDLGRILEFAPRRVSLRTRFGT